MTDLGGDWAVQDRTGKAHWLLGNYGDKDHPNPGYGTLCGESSGSRGWSRPENTTNRCGICRSRLNLRKNNP